MATDKLNTTDEREQRELPLEIDCPACGPHSRRDCRLCHGTGCMPTQMGDAVLNLVQRHLSRMLQDAEG